VQTFPTNPLIDNGRGIEKPAKPRRRARINGMAGDEGVNLRRRLGVKRRSDSHALLLSGALGPIAGRMIDRRGGRDVLAATNVVFAAGLGLLSMASGSVSLAAAWIVLGVGIGFGLYEAAFATATGVYGADARNAITGITLWAGFASTVGWPASTFFIGAFGWRGACLASASLHLAIGLPLNVLLVPNAPGHKPATVPPPDKRQRVPVSMKLAAWAMRPPTC